MALGLPPPRPSGLTACQRGRHSALGDTRAPSRGRKANWRICLTTTKRLTWYVFSSSNTYMSQLWLIHSSKLKSKPSSVVHPFLTVQTAPPPFLVPSPPWVRAGAGPEEPWGLAGALPWWLLPRPGTRPGVQAMTRRVRREAGWVCRKMSTAERGGGGPQRPPVHTPLHRWGSHRAASRPPLPPGQPAASLPVPPGLPLAPTILGPLGSSETSFQEPGLSLAGPLPASPTILGVVTLKWQ